MRATQSATLLCFLSLLCACSGATSDALSTGLGNEDGGRLSDASVDDDAQMNAAGEGSPDASESGLDASSGLDAGVDGVGDIDGAAVDGSVVDSEVDASPADAGSGAGGACCGPADYDTQADTTLPSDVSCGTWRLSNNGDVELPMLANQKLHTSTSADAENMYFIHNAANLSIPDTLTIEARLMVGLPWRRAHRP